MKKQLNKLIVGALIFIVLLIVVLKVQEGAVPAPSPPIIPSASVSLSTTTPPSGSGGVASKSAISRSAKKTSL
jgi:hypothetical protein